MKFGSRFSLIGVVLVDAHLNWQGIRCLKETIHWLNSPAELAIEGVRETVWVVLVRKAHVSPRLSTKRWGSARIWGRAGWIKQQRCF